MGIDVLSITLGDALHFSEANFMSGLFVRNGSGLWIFSCFFFFWTKSIEQPLLETLYVSNWEGSLQQRWPHLQIKSCSFWFWGRCMKAWKSTKDGKWFRKQEDWEPWFGSLIALTEGFTQSFSKPIMNGAVARKGAFDWFSCAGHKAMVYSQFKSYHMPDDWIRATQHGACVLPKTNCHFPDKCSLIWRDVPQVLQWSWEITEYVSEASCSL